MVVDVLVLGFVGGGVVEVVVVGGRVVVMVDGKVVVLDKVGVELVLPTVNRIPKLNTYLKHLLYRRQFGRVSTVMKFTWHAATSNAVAFVTIVAPLTLRQWLYDSVASACARPEVFAGVVAVATYVWVF